MGSQFVLTSALGDNFGGKRSGKPIFLTLNKVPVIRALHTCVLLCKNVTKGLRPQEASEMM